MHSANGAGSLSVRSPRSARSARTNMPADRRKMRREPTRHGSGPLERRYAIHLCDNSCSDGGTPQYVPRCQHPRYNHQRPHAPSTYQCSRQSCSKSTQQPLTFRARRRGGGRCIRIRSSECKDQCVQLSSNCRPSSNEGHRGHTLARVKPPDAGVRVTLTDLAVSLCQQGRGRLDDRSERSGEVLTIAATLFVLCCRCRQTRRQRGFRIRRCYLRGARIRCTVDGFNPRYAMRAGPQAAQCPDLDDAAFGAGPALGRTARGQLEGSDMPAIAWQRPAHRHIVVGRDLEPLCGSSQWPAVIDDTTRQPQSAQTPTTGHYGKTRRSPPRHQYLPQWDRRRTVG